MAAQQMAANKSIDTIQNAFSRLQDALYPSDAALFRETTPEAVKDAIKIIERDQEGRRSLRGLRRIQPFFHGLSRLGGAIETLCQGTPYLCFIWAPVKLLLQIADEYTKGFEALLDAYGQIAQHLPRLDRFASIFQDQPDFQEVLANVYAGILDFHLHAYKMLRRKGWKLIFDALWKDFQGKFTSLLRDLARNKALLDEEANSFNILEAKAFRNRMYEELDREETERRQRHLRDTLTWLDLQGQDKEQQDLFDRRSSAREPSTCEWILNHSTIATWLDDEDLRVFVRMHGKPGSGMLVVHIRLCTDDVLGKTTLATYLMENASVPPNCDLLYCLCTYGLGRADGNVCSLVLRSLIAQLIRAHVDLLPHLYETYVKDSTVLTMSKVKEVLLVFLDMHGTIFLILDGLDECEAKHQKQILEELAALAEPYQHAGHGPDIPRLKILVCSRETRDINRKLNRAPCVSLTKETRLVSRDIATFTNRCTIDIKTRFGPVVADEVKKELTTKAEGWSPTSCLAVETDKRQVCFYGYSLRLKYCWTRSV
jgi:hypothetical protein